MFLVILHHFIIIEFNTILSTFVLIDKEFSRIIVSPYFFSLSFIDDLNLISIVIAFVKGRLVSQWGEQHKRYTSGVLL